MQMHWLLQVWLLAVCSGLRRLQSWTNNDVHSKGLSLYYASDKAYKYIVYNGHVNPLLELLVQVKTIFVWHTYSKGAHMMYQGNHYGNLEECVWLYNLIGNAKAQNKYNKLNSSIGCISNSYCGWLWAARRA